MPPTPIEFLKVNVNAFKEVLDSKKAAEKKGAISWAFAEDFNKLLEQAKKAEPAIAEHLPEPIKFIDQGYGMRTVQHVDYLHIEIMITRIIGVIRLFETKQ
jgi:hypothetical protein